MSQRAVRDELLFYLGRYGFLGLKANARLGGASCAY